MDEKKKTRRKALETFLSGKQTSGKGTEKGRDTPAKEEVKKMKEEALAAPTAPKGLKIRGRKKGVRTPRQTFRIDETIWKRFQAATRKKESLSASEVLRRFIHRYVGDK